MDAKSKGVSVRESLDLAFRFAQSQGLATYDPFDTKGCRLGLWLYKSDNGFRRILRKGFNGLDLLFPLGLRKVLRLPKKPSHGGVGRWAQANIAFGKLTGESRYRARAWELLEWLGDRAAKSEHGKGWALPFDWQAFVMVPAGTPIGHTTMGVINAMIDGVESGGADWIWNEIEEGCTFLAEGLNLTTRESGAISLSYTPLDTSQVINTNAEIAAVLAKVGLRRNRPEWVDLSRKIARFVLETQNVDSSWCYSAPDAGEGRQVIDHYHTGMILTALLDLEESFAEEELGQRLRGALNDGLKFHLDHHFEINGCPRMRPDALFPIDSYSAGESLLLLSRICKSAVIEPENRQRSRETLEKLAGFVTSPVMMFKDGCFIYRIWGMRKMRLESLRWAQGLICHGLIEYLLLVGGESEESA